MANVSATSAVSNLFSSELAEHAGSLPRPALVKELDRLLFEEASHFVLLVGGAGRGKSALVTQYLAHLEAGSGGKAKTPEKKPGLFSRLFGGGGKAAETAKAGGPRRIPYHFLRRGITGTAQPAEVARSLAEQIEASYPEQKDPQAEPELRLAELLTRVSNKVLVPSGQRLVLMIDGLHEVEQAELGSPLPRFLPATVPANVSILCVARPGDPNLDWLLWQSPRSLDLDDARWQPEGEAAVQAFWKHHGGRFLPKLPDDVVAEAVARAEGNLLHATGVRGIFGALAAEQRTAANIPRGLTGLWQQTLAQVRALPQGQLAEAALGLLAVAQTALPPRELGRLLADKGDLALALPLLRPVLLPLGADDALPAELRLHGSLREYVLGELGQETLRAHHLRLAKVLCPWPQTEANASFAGRYALRFGLLHRALAGDVDGAVALARDLAYLQTAAQICGAEALCTDLAQAAAALSPAAASRELFDLHHAMRRELTWLSRHPEALPELLYNRLICLGWSAARIEQSLRFPRGLPALRLRFPIQQDGSASEHVFDGVPADKSTTQEGRGLQRCLVLPGREPRVLVGSIEGALHLWQISRSGQRLLWSSRAHGGAVHALHRLPGERVLSTGADGLLKVFDLNNGQEVLSLGGISGAMQCCVVLPDAHSVICGGADGTLRQWELRPGAAAKTVASGPSAILACCLLADGRLASAAEDRMVRIWDLESGQVVRELQGHTAPVSALLPLPDGRLCSASLDGTVRIWQQRAEEAPTCLRGHNDGIIACAVLPGERLLTSSLDGTLRISRLGDGGTLAICEGHSGWVTDCALQDDTAGGVRFLSVSLDGTVRTWDANTAERLYALNGHQSFVTALALVPGPGAGRLLSASRDQTLKVWDLATGHHLRTLRGHTASVDECAVLPDGQRAVSASYDTTLRVWDLDTGQALSTMRGHSGWVSSCAALPDSEQVVSAAMDGTLRVWDARTGKQLRSLVGHSDSVTACALCPDGKRVVSASADGTLRVWQLATGEQTQALHGHSASVDRCAILPDGERVLSASADGTLKLWDLRTGAHQQTLAGHGAWISAYAVLAKGQKVLSAAGDETLRVWDLRTGQTLRTLVGHRAAIYSCAALPDGRRAVSAAGDGMVKLWDTESGECLATVYGSAAAGFFSVLAVKDWIFAGDVLGNVWMLSCP